MELIEGLTAAELRYIRACIEVADDEGDLSHAQEFGVEYGQIMNKLNSAIASKEQ